MLACRLACHGEVFAKFTKRLPVLLAQKIEQLPAVGSASALKTRSASIGLARM